MQVAAVELHTAAAVAVTRINKVRTFFGFS
jgi:hypothetical protein